MELERIKFRHSVCKFWVLAGVAIGLFVAGFFIPPLGVIDGSVLKAGGIILGFYTVGLIPEMIRAGQKVKFSHGETSMEVCADEEKNDQKTT